MSYQSRYYVATGPSSWDSTQSWSLTPGGPSGATIPDQYALAVFDKSGSGPCIIGANTTVSGIVLQTPFDGTIIQNYDTTVGNDGLTASAGMFNSNSSLTVLGTLYISPTCAFNPPSTTMHLYGHASFPSNFLSNNGTISAYGGAKLDTSSIHFNVLDIESSQAGSAVTVDGTCYVDGTLSLTGGYLKSGLMCNLHLTGTLSTSNGFGSYDNKNDLQIIMDGSGVQNLNYGGGIIPGLLIDKTYTNPVMCSGLSPIRINGDFNLQDGTFMLNGLDLRAGI